MSSKDEVVDLCNDDDDDNVVVPTEAADDDSKKRKREERVRLPVLSSSLRTRCRATSASTMRTRYCVPAR